MLTTFVCTLMCAGAADLTFTAEKPGYFAFDTGAIKGVVRADGKSEGVVELTDLATGTSLVNPEAPGILSLYRVFSGATRFPDARNAPHRATLNAARAELTIVWDAAPERPYTLTGRFTLADARALDLTLECTAERALPSFEIFVSSYTALPQRHFVFLKGTLHQGGKPDALLYEPTATPFLEGCYLAFPRDIPATKTIFDGRWQQNPNPVHFAAGRNYAVPLMGSRHAQNGATLLLMARPEECFALETTYVRPEGPDSVSGHNSLYLSLGGADLAAGATARFHLRAAVATLARPEDALGFYKGWSESGAAK
jgi:hypothetical protein